MWDFRVFPTCLLCKWARMPNGTSLAGRRGERVKGESLLIFRRFGFSPMHTKLRIIYLPLFYSFSHTNSGYCLMGFWAKVSPKMALFVTCGRSCQFNLTFLLTPSTKGAILSFAHQSVCLLAQNVMQNSNNAGTNLYKPSFLAMFVLLPKLPKNLNIT